MENTFCSHFLPNTWIHWVPFKTSLQMLNKNREGTRHSFRQMALIKCIHQRSLLINLRGNGMGQKSGTILNLLHAWMSNCHSYNDYFELMIKMTFKIINCNLTTAINDRYFTSGLFYFTLLKLSYFEWMNYELVHIEWDS